jgi:hypothetical protein
LFRFTLDALHEHRKRMLAERNAAGTVFFDLQDGHLRKGAFGKRRRQSGTG